MIDFDDKDLVIICVTVIALACIGWLSDAQSIINAIVAGLFGVAVGRKLE